jgi:hypothetical protein
VDKTHANKGKDASRINTGMLLNAYIAIAKKGKRE